MSDVTIKTVPRLQTDITELDRVLGSGLVENSLTLLSGEPGVGKSTLLLTLASKITNKYKDYKLLYITGEETSSQIALRAKRLGINSKNIYLLNETKWEDIKRELDNINPNLLILDSIQTTVSDEINGMVGSVSQIKEITFEMMNYIKSKDMTGILIGHINKDGGIAGPKVLEHMVDTVLYFEGDRYGHKRVLRAIKNRFGNTNEIGLFNMKNNGLVEIKEKLTIAQQDAPGRVLSCTVKGSRVYFVEIQVLVKPMTNSQPKVICHGIDQNRVTILMAVIEKHLKINLSCHDIYISTDMEFKLSTKEIDIALIAAIISSIKNKSIPSDLVYMGEVGLDGKIKPLQHNSKELNEIEQFGLKYQNCSNIKEMII